MRRYVALDSWRGLCACLVVLFHVFAYSHFYEALRPAYLCVDFFFVLSGFVITASNEKRLLEGYSLRKFMARRVGRIYPLHLFILCCLATAYGAKTVFLHGGNVPDAAFSFKAFLCNIFLLQGLDVLKDTSWNVPSWSISAECTTYMLFGLGVLGLRKRVWQAELAILLTAPVLLYVLAPGHTMDVTFNYGLLRSLYGFALGGLCFKLQRLFFFPSRLASPIEILSVASALLFAMMTARGALSILAPFPFALVILVFAQEKGILSRLLLQGGFIKLGELSYSIYMVHWLILYIFMNVSGFTAKHLHVPFSTIVQAEGGPKQLMAARMWEGDVILPLILSSTILVSLATHRFIEKPAENWIRRKIGGEPWRGGPPMSEARNGRAAAAVTARPSGTEAPAAS